MAIVISWYWNINQMSEATLIQHVDNICNIDIRYLARVRPWGHRQLYLIATTTTSVTSMITDTNETVTIEVSITETTEEEDAN